MPKCDFCEIRGWSGKAYCLKKDDYVENSTYDNYCNSWRFDDCSIYKSSSSSGCYLTTACVDHKGLPDDCFELNTLRQFRDGYLVSAEDGREQIEEYYRTAPGIVAAIDKSGRGAAIYEVLYDDVILPCVDLIENGRNEEARQMYVDMVEKLKKEFC